MSIKATPEKLAGLKAVSNERGVIAAVAMDQRGSLRKSLARARGVPDVPDGLIKDFKSLVAEELCQHVSAILLDPQFGLPASRKRHDAGLLLSYERSGYDTADSSRSPDLLEHWSVGRLKDAGADCIKILLYYTPFAVQDVNDRKHAFIERVGAECRAHALPFFLECVGYDVHSEGESSMAFALRKPQIVTGSMQEFGKAKYGVDVQKVEIPVQMKFVEGTAAFAGEKVYSRKEAMEHFRVAASSTSNPFIYLSSGVSNAVFVESLGLAAESGVAFNGVLSGRADWSDGVAIFARYGEAALRTWLNTVGLENVGSVNEALLAARPWSEKLSA
jgi:tagatose 1,6-diphosphate aldolase